MSNKTIERVEEYCNSKAPQYKLLLKYKRDEISNINTNIGDIDMDLELYKLKQELELENKETGKKLETTEAILNVFGEKEEADEIRTEIRNDVREARKTGDKIAEAKGMLNSIAFEMAEECLNDSGGNNKAKTVAKTVMRDRLTIEELSIGAVARQINTALKEMVDDIINIKKDAKAKREVIIKISLVPLDYEFGRLKVNIKTKLAPMSKIEGIVEIGCYGDAKEIKIDGVQMTLADYQEIMAKRRAENY